MFVCWVFGVCVWVVGVCAVILASVWCVCVCCVFVLCMCVWWCVCCLLCVRVLCVSDGQDVRRSEYSGSIQKETNKFKPHGEVNNLLFSIMIRSLFSGTVQCVKV